MKTGRAVRCLPGTNCNLGTGNELRQQLGTLPLEPPAQLFPHLDVIASEKVCEGKRASEPSVLSLPEVAKQ